MFLDDLKLYFPVNIIGVDEDHVHFLIQSIPMYSVTQLVKMIKSLTARQLLSSCPEIKKQLWGGNIWTSGYYVNTVGQYDKKRSYSTLYCLSKAARRATRVFEFGAL